MKGQLRDLAKLFIDECNKEGEDAIEVIQNYLKQFENENLETKSADDISKQDYFRIAEKIIREEPSLKKKIPLPDALRAGIEIFYIVHQKNYHDDMEFCEMAAEVLNLEMVNIRRSVLGNSYASMRSGIAVFLYKFQLEGEKAWHDNKIYGRLELLEEAERNLFERIKAVM